MGRELRLGQVCKIYGRSVEWWRKEAVEGRIPYYKHPKSGEVTLDSDDVERFQSSRKRNVNAFEEPVERPLTSRERTRRLVEAVRQARIKAGYLKPDEQINKR